MGRSLFSHNTDTPEIAVIYDLSSAGVGAALVHLPAQADVSPRGGRNKNVESTEASKGKDVTPKRKKTADDVRKKREQAARKPKIIFSTRHALPFQDTYDPDRLLQMLTQAIKETGEEIQTQGLPRLQDVDALKNVKNPQVAAVHCYFSSPWYISHTQRVEFVRDNPIEVTPDFLRKQVRRSRDLLEETAVTEYIEDVAEDLVLLEEEVLQVTLNGYPTTQPFGQTAKTIELATYISLIPEAVTASIEQAVAGVFHLKNVRFHTFTRGAYIVVQEQLEVTDDFLFVDVSGELTEISLINDGLLVESVSFPLGKHFIGRALSEALDLDGDAALSQARANLSGHHNDNRTKAVVDEAQKRWQTLVRKAIKGFPEDASIPSVLYMVADSEALPFFERFMSELDCKDLLLTQDNFDVIHLGRDEFKDLVIDVSDEDSHGGDVFLALETLFSAR